MVKTLSIKQISTHSFKRLIAVADIHGELDLFQKLLAKVDFCDKDALILLGDFYLKGSRPEDCFKFVMELAQRPNVHVLRGNCEWSRDDFLSDNQWAWLESLPIIIESEDFTFVHAGLEAGPLHEQDFRYCLTKYAFLEEYDGPPFKKWVMAGHWPTNNLQHQAPNHNPIICEQKRIICIDGGNVISSSGQLNAFIVHMNRLQAGMSHIASFSWQHADNFNVIKIQKAQDGSRGTLNITWLDRFIEIKEQGEEFSLIKHIKSGKMLKVPTAKIWQDKYGKLCSCDQATDHWLEVNKDDEVSVVTTYSDRIFAKKDGEAGWIAGFGS
jgi:protein phosphatase